MGMRLLTKTDIQQQKASARRLEIEEGKKLSQSVDRLRELKVFEEQSLEAFRVKSISNIHSEIAAETSKLDDLKREVKDLEAKRKLALEPLDAEWQAINDEKILVGDRLELVKDREEAVANREAAVAETEKQTTYLLNTATTKEKVAQKLLDEAAANSNNAERMKKEATYILDKATKFKEKSEKQLLDRETKVAMAERTLRLKETNLADERASLDKEWALLEDRKAQLERTIKRLKK